MFRLVATSGWSRPSCFSRIARLRLVERLGVGVPAHGPVQFRQVVQAGGHVGVVAPSCFSLIARLRLKSGSASAYRPMAGTGPPGCSGWWPRRGGRAQLLLPDLQAAAVERLGLGVPAHGRYRSARLFRLVATTGWSGPSSLPGSPGCAGRAARPRRTGPWHGTGPPGCSGWWPRRGGRARIYRWQA